MAEEARQRHEEVREAERQLKERSRDVEAAAAAVQASEKARNEAVQVAARADVDVRECEEALGADEKKKVRAAAAWTGRRRNHLQHGTLFSRTRFCNCMFPTCLCCHVSVDALPAFLACASGKPGVRGTRSAGRDCSRASVTE